MGAQASLAYCKHDLARERAMSHFIRNFAAFLLLATCAATPVIAADEPIRLYFSADVTIESDGSLSRLEWNRGDEIPAVLRTRLDARVRSWKFVPGTIEGTPAVTETTLQLRLLATPQGDDVALQVENATTGATLVDMVPPDYPREALRRGAEAAVLANLSVSPGGAREVSIAGYDGDQRMRPKFEKAVDGMFRGVTVEFERVGGLPAPAEFAVPVEFCLGTNPCGPYDWPERETASAPGQPMPRDSVAGIATDVKGAAI